MSIKFLVLGGGAFWVGGGGKCRFYFYGRGDFSEIIFGDTELKCSKCYDRKAKMALRTSNCCNR